MLYGRSYDYIPPCSCGNTRPKQSGCVDCRRECCEYCVETVDGELVCSDCLKKREEVAIEKHEAFEASEAEARAEVMKRQPTVHDMAWFYRWMDAR